METFLPMPPLQNQSLARPPNWFYNGSWTGGTLILIENDYRGRVHSPVQ